MSVTRLDDILEDFSKRLYRLEQAVSTPGSFGSSGGGSNTFEEIILDDPDDTDAAIVIVPFPPEVPLNVTAAPGSHYDVIYVDVEWEASEEGEAAVVYEVELAEKTAPDTYEIAQVVRTAGTNIRISNLEPDTDYGVRVTAMSRIGLFSDPTAWTDFDSGSDNTVPGQITGVTIGRGATSAVVTFDPSTAEDVAGGEGLYEVQIDTANTFNTANLRVIRTTSWVVAFQGIQTESNYYARVSAIDSSGNQGPWSATAGPSVIGGVIDSMIAGTIHGAKITVGTLDGDRIIANSASVGILETSDLTSADITLNGGSFKAGSPPTTGLLINSQGLRLYSGGVQTITLDAATGAATFRGNIAGGTINIGSKFAVDSAGNMTATDGNFSGNINGANITGGIISGAIFKTATAGTAADPVIWIGDTSVAGNRKYIYFVIGNNTTANAGYMQMYSGSFEIRAPGAGNVYVIANNSTVTVGNTGELYCQGALRAGTSVSGSSGSFSSLNINGQMSVGSSGNLSSQSGTFNFLNVGAYSVVHDGNIGSKTAGGAFGLSGAPTISVTSINGSGSLTMQGIYDNTTTTAANVNTSTQGWLRRVSSSGELKTIVKGVRQEKDSALIYRLKARTFTSRLHPGDLGGGDDPTEIQYGFIMEELHDVDPVFTINEVEHEQKVVKGESRFVPKKGGKKQPIGVDWNAITAMLVTEVQKLREEVDALKSAA